MLLPALAAAREKARRSSCMNNLNQMGKGLESYCGDYGQYFPSWPAWQGPAYGTQLNTGGMAVSGDSGFYTDPRKMTHSMADILSGSFHGSDPGVVRTNATFAHWFFGWQDAPISKLRCVFAGDKGTSKSVYTSGGYTHVNAVKGELNMAPMGLGYLVVAGYAPDARMLFCSSTGGNMPAPVGTESGPDNDGSKPFNAATSVKQLQTAGGFDAHSILYGDWYGAIGGFWDGRDPGDGDSGAVFSGNAVLSDYAYRNMPVGIGYKYRTWAGDVAEAWKKVYLATTKPRVAVSPGAPSFKTQKNPRRSCNCGGLFRAKPLAIHRRRQCARGRRFLRAPRRLQRALRRLARQVAWRRKAAISVVGSYGPNDRAIDRWQLRMGRCSPCSLQHGYVRRILVLSLLGYRRRLQYPLHLFRWNPKPFGHRMGRQQRHGLACFGCGRPNRRGNPGIGL